jgi:hypothetical protein
MFSPSMAVAAASAAVHLSGYAVYSVRMRNGHARPNMATWTLWVFLSALNCTSYLVMSGDPAKAAVAFAGATACTFTFLYSLKRGRVSRLTPGDAAALGFGLLAAGVWIALRSATFANLILQAGFFVSMIPTARGILKDPTAERPLPWMLWGTAYALNLSVVLARWHGQYPDLAYPLLTMVTHGGMGFLALAMARRPSTAEPAPAAID